MDDHPQAEACPVESPTAADSPTSPIASSAETLYEQVRRVLPRLAEIGTSVALLAPFVINSSDSFGGRVRGC